MYPLRAERVIKLVHWNINGLLRDDNKEHLAEVLVSKNIDICLLNETHLKFGYNDDLSAFKLFTVYSRENFWEQERRRLNDYSQART